MGGYQKQVLRINLSNLTIAVEPLDMETAQLYLGGRGLGAKYLYDEISQGIDPLSADNKIIFATGILTGTPAPTAGRYMVVTKSPLSGTIASSNSGGHWGNELKRAGYDIVIVEGKSSTPVYIYINNQQVEIRSAEAYWGSLVSEATNRLVNDIGDPKARVLAIGPAGEKMSLISAVINEYDRAAARNGVGAVMGSKNLKAIVVRGTNQVAVADKGRFGEAVQRIMQKIRENDITGRELPSFGTSALAALNYAIHEHTDVSGKEDPTSSTQMLVRESGNLQAQKDPCVRCPIACGRYYKGDEIEGVGPEYASIRSYNVNCGIMDMDTIFRLNKLCNEMGLDTISAGATLSAAMELYNRGHITREELDGPELLWGDGASVLEWTRKIGASEGFGAKMAMGSARLCAEYGCPELSVTVKGQEVPKYEKQSIQGIGIHLATSNRGGCNMRGNMIAPEALGLADKVDITTEQGKVIWAKTFQNFTAAADSLGICLFTSFALTIQDYVDLYNATSGKQSSIEDFLHCGDRIWNLERMFNLREGYTATDDRLPKQVLEDAYADTSEKDTILKKMLTIYYQVRGWNEAGIPTHETQKSLQII